MNGESDCALNLYSASPNSDTEIVAGDYDSLGTTAYATAISFETIAGNDWSTFTLNPTGLAALQSAISSGGVFRIGLRESIYDAANEAPVWGSNQDAYVTFYSADFSEDDAPTLTITYATKPIENMVRGCS